MCLLQSSMSERVSSVSKELTFQHVWQAALGSIPNLVMC